MNREHVLAADLAEVLRHRQPGQGDAEARAGGGSFICPKTIIVLSMTPDSVIST
ncbi:MAG: hypothetical protein R2691_06520 [Solirubrobacterales bacterium]